MKKIYFTLVILAAMASSCQESFINLTPEDTYTDNSFYKTESQFQQAIVAAYAPLRDVLLNDYFTSEMHSDNTIYQPRPSDRGTANLQRENISDFTNTSTNAYANAVWQHCYTGISRTNMVIERLPGAQIPEASKNLIGGQAKFLRAWYYFKLVRLYGGVPLFLKEVTKADDAFLPRSTAQQVYDQIIADAKDAVAALAAPAKFPQTGEATKGSATMLLAEVYATLKNWAEVESLLSTLPAMGYGLNQNYADVFSPANKNSRESLFEAQFLEGTVLGTTPNIMTLHFIPRSSNTAPITGISINNSATGGWNTPTRDLINSFEATDTRLDASIGIAEGTYNSSDLFTYSAVKSVVNYTPAAGKTGVPYIKKYLHAPLAAVTGSNDNFPIYRYSDALLLLAEAQNELGKSPLESLNAVRIRAGLPPVTAADKETLRDIIWHERRVELAFENHRWHDLVRTGKAIDVINALGRKLKEEVSYLSPDAYNITADRLLFPIPQTEVELNPGTMVQNPGYF